MSAVKTKSSVAMCGGLIMAEESGLVRRVPGRQEGPLGLVAVLCAARNSIYKQLDNVDVYDADRDARTFAGGMPIVAHPPCRSWSKYTRQQATPEPGEQELGLWCCERLRECGGVLEQPAGSYLFEAAGFPVPGEGARNGVWSAYVWQAWWGYPMRKATWLAFCGVPQERVTFPFRLHARGADRRREQLMSKNQRSATTREMAEWLLNTARMAMNHPRAR